MVALTAVPALWVELDRGAILRDFTALVVRLLDLDLAYACLGSEVDGRSHEHTHGPGGASIEAARAACAAVERTPRTARPTGVADLGELTLYVLPVGLGQFAGTLLVGSARPSFPTEIERMLLEVAGSQAAIAIRSAWMLEELRAADRRKNEFLAMLAHELRNPLGPMLNALEVVAGSGPRGDQTAALQAIVERQTRHLMRLVDDLLDVSRIQSGKITLQLEVLDLREVAHRVLETLHASGRAREHAVSMSLGIAPVPVRGDPARLEQVLSNLVDNAVKYTPAGGTINVTVERESDSGVIRVSDTGAGLAPELVGHVFDIFTQGESTLDRSKGGLGLGLALVRGLAVEHGGSASARSAGVGRGSEFTVRLPLTASRVVPGDTGATTPVEPRRLVLIDDNRDAREALRALCEFEGHSVRTAGDGVEAITLIRESQPDAAIVDIGLPLLDGYAVARELRSYRELDAVLLVALTGYGQPEDRRKALEAGFDIHLVKPVDARELAKVIAGSPRRI